MPRIFMRITLALALCVGAVTLSAHFASAIVDIPGSRIVQISQDPFSNASSQHRTEVEPDVFAYGSTAVAVVQQGRFYDGGASDIGYSTSKDGGKTWKYGSLPGITKIQDPAKGKFDRVSDPTIAYDAKHGDWLAASLPLAGQSSPIGQVPLVSASGDGLTWSAPVEVAGNNGDYMDKDWIVCDNGHASPFAGHCYVEWDDNSQGDQVYMSVSGDGGRTWATPIAVANAFGLGGQPLAQPSGHVVVPYLDANGNISAFSSFDGGKSWDRNVLVSATATHVESGNLRSQQLPSAQVDGAGRLYVVWQDCSFRSNCSANDIVLSTSTDGTTWSGKARIPIDPVTSGVDHFVPGIAVDAATSGSSARLGVTYYDYAVSNCSTSTCRLFVGFIGSRNGGTTWQSARTLTAAMNVTWLANTNQGYMVGDYIASAFTGGGVHGAFADAAPPGGNLLAESLFTSTAALAPAGVERSSYGERPIVGAHSDHAFRRAGTAN